MHVTYRVVDGIVNLRRPEMTAAIVGAIAKAHKATFRVCHFTIQDNHLHLIVEAETKRTLARGLQGLSSRIARSVNRVVGRTGKLFADRYHARELGTPTEVRNALRYVLLNHAKHNGRRIGIDAFCSSGTWFGGWRNAPATNDGRAVAKPVTRLLTVAWKREGRIDAAERPG